MLIKDFEMLVLKKFLFESNGLSIMIESSCLFSVKGEFMTSLKPLSTRKTLSLSSIELLFLVILFILNSLTVILLYPITLAISSAKSF